MLCPQYGPQYAGFSRKLETSFGKVLIEGNSI